VTDTLELGPPPALPVVVRSVQPPSVSRKTALLTVTFADCASKRATMTLMGLPPFAWP